MKTFLTYNGQLRSETDPSAISNLIRKGWVETPQPEFNAATQSCDWKGGDWVVSAIATVSPIALGEQHVEASGFSAARLVTMFDLFLQTKEANALASKPKLVALYTWLQTVKATAVAGGTDFTAPPYSFEEVVSE